MPGDGATYHKAEFSLLTFYPKIQEVIEGEVVEVTDYRVSSNWVGNRTERPALLQSQGQAAACVRVRHGDRG